MDAKVVQAKRVMQMYAIGAPHAFECTALNNSVWL